MGSHVVVPLPAEDVDGNRIHPLNYEEKLRGAVVRVGFVLNHYFPLNGKHRFTADVDNMRVLIPPTPEPSVALSAPQTPLSPPASPQRERVARGGSNAGGVKAKREDVTPPATPTRKRKHVVEPELDESDVEVKREDEEVPLAKKQKLSAKANQVVKKEEED